MLNYEVRKSRFSENRLWALKELVVSMLRWKSFVKSMRTEKVNCGSNVINWKEKNDNDENKF